MRVSVIIPVFQAERFIDAAVASALNQPETAEVILIEDGSSDQSLERCRALASDDSRVIVLTHPGHQNKGAAASRNLGITHAQMPFIAFLDSDDLFEASRFRTTAEVFDRYPDADGVYEVIGARYETPEARIRHLVRMGRETTGIRKQVPPEQLFRTLASGKHGHLSPIGLTLKTRIAQQTEFDPALVMSEDADYILRLAARYRLYSGALSKPVSLRRVHDANSVFTNPGILKFRRAYLQKCVEHHFYGSQDLLAALYIISRRVGASGWFQPFRKLGNFALPFKIIGMTGYLLIRPRVILDLIRIIVS